MVNFERRLLWYALLGGFPAVIATLYLLGRTGYHANIVWAVAVLVVGTWIKAALALKRFVVSPLRGLSGLLAAIMDQDFSVRAHGSGPCDALGLVKFEVNELAATLHKQRLDALEATVLLKTLVEEIDVAICAFDSTKHLAFANKVAQSVLRLSDRDPSVAPSASDLGLGECFETEQGGIIELDVHGARTRLQVRRSAFRSAGRKGELFVLADVSRSLREEEVRTLQRIVRVLNHEINNSLAPIKSISQTLSLILDSSSIDMDSRADIAEGLAVITSRADSLSRFIDGYTKLARLPPPQKVMVSLDETLRRVVALDSRVPIELEMCVPVVIPADPPQLEQLLINLVRNAADASAETGGAVTVGYECKQGRVEIVIEDEGPGLSNSANLFVPFFTTKPGGSGVGLALSRQIAEAHGGTLTLANREDECGCVAVLSLPLRDSPWNTRLALP